MIVEAVDRGEVMSKEILELAEELAEKLRVSLEKETKVSKPGLDSNDPHLEKLDKMAAMADKAADFTRASIVKWLRKRGSTQIWRQHTVLMIADAIEAKEDLE